MSLTRQSPGAGLLAMLQHLTFQHPCRLKHDLVEATSQLCTTVSKLELCNVTITRTAPTSTAQHVWGHHSTARLRYRCTAHLHPTSDKLKPSCFTSPFKPNHLPHMAPGISSAARNLAGWSRTVVDNQIIRKAALLISWIL
jgi:hypothetical protein